MSTNKPKIPKALAARIRCAQSRLESCIQVHIWAEKDIPELEARIVLFESDPEEWAETNYPKCGGSMSYPVQTNITRSRESLERKLARRAHELKEFQDAEENLRRVEEDVLTTVRAMRPTSGRVSWPKPVRSAEIQAAKLHNELSRLRLRATAEQQFRDDQQLLACAHEQKRRREEEIVAIRSQLEKGPEHVIRVAMSSREVKSAFQYYKKSPEYSEAQNNNWTGGLVSFARSPEAARASDLGLRKAKEVIEAARERKEDLWDVCRQLGFYNPELFKEI